MTCDLYMCHNIVTEAYITSSGGDMSSDVSIIISSHIIYIIYIIYTWVDMDTITFALSSRISKFQVEETVL